MSPDIIPKKHQHPWGRTYREGKLAMLEYDENYWDAVKKTPPYDSGPHLLDIIDTAVFGQLDYVMGHKADDKYRQDRADHPQCPALHFGFALLPHWLREQRVDDDEVAVEDKKEDEEETECDEDVNNKDRHTAWLIMLKAAGDIA
ncbi:hypothetical protein A6R68_09975 [Neotoma lepida]|uniref:FAM20 C-terminal domain-containing protein n=1 Tax=Neotoma lepida TaxID=56216 RepID=A0A1A6FZ51_NEOLE|nr:hypothetical protein A6R68_09975 [Neotoma lepida]